MSEPTCNEVRDLAPEAALGIAGGEERARVLAHVAHCAECRSYLGELAGAFDELLSMIPPREPPPGFESRALARMTAPQRTRRRRITAPIAAALAGAALAALGMFAATRSDHTLASHYRATLARAEGKEFTVASLRNAAGASAGEVFAYEGHPSWMFVVVETPTTEASVDVIGVLRDGTTQSIGKMRLRDTGGSWGGVISVAVERLAAVKLVDESGASLFSASFDTR
jgi:hypothetical protein